MSDRGRTHTPRGAPTPTDALAWNVDWMRRASRARRHISTRGTHTNAQTRYDAHTHYDVYACAEGADARGAHDEETIVRDYSRAIER